MTDPSMTIVSRNIATRCDEIVRRACAPAFARNVELNKPTHSRADVGWRLLHRQVLYTTRVHNKHAVGLAVISLCPAISVLIIQRAWHYTTPGSRTAPLAERVDQKVEGVNAGHDLGGPHATSMIDTIDLECNRAIFRKRH